MAQDYRRHEDERGYGRQSNQQRDQQYGRGREPGHFDAGDGEGYASGHESNWRAGAERHGSQFGQQGHDGQHSQQGYGGQYGGYQGGSSFGQYQGFGRQWGSRDGGPSGHNQGYGGQGDGVFGFTQPGASGGEHRGRGPKNYERSDDRIREDVCDRLSDDPHVDASEIDVSASKGEVTLTGSVTSRDQRRRAEECVESITGVKHVQNNLRVQQAGRPGSSASASAGTDSSGTPSAGQSNSSGSIGASSQTPAQKRPTGS